MHEVRANLFEILDRDPDWENLMQSVDTNDDGRLDFDEFCNATYNRRKLLNDKNLRIAFDLFDSNKDGVIDREELSQYLAETTLDDLSMHEIDMPQETWTRLINDCDTNGDGKIDFDEFHRYLSDQMERQLLESAKLPDQDVAIAHIYNTTEGEEEIEDRQTTNDQ